MARVRPARPQPTVVLLPNPNTGGPAQGVKPNPTVPEIQPEVRGVLLLQIGGTEQPREPNFSEKFILSVSIIADIEQCPETPPPAEPMSGGAAAPPATANNALPTTPVYGTTAVPTNV